MGNLSDRINGIQYTPAPQSPASAGFIQAFAGATAPQGWALCDGAVLEQADYPDLFAALGSNWNAFAHPVDGTPSVGGSQFALPNLKGLYLAMAGDSGGDARTLGVFQDDGTGVNGLSNSSSSISGSTNTTGDHAHTINAGNAAGTSFTRVSKAVYNTTTVVSGGNNGGDHSHTVSGTANAQSLSGDNETRPKTAPIQYIIKLYSDKANAVSVGLEVDPFSKYAVGVGDSPYTIPRWDAVIEIHNDTGDIELILPAATAKDEGKELKLWIEHNPSNNKVLFKAASTSDTINNVANDGVEVARAEYSSNKPNFFRVTAQAMGANEIYIDQATSVFNQLRYVANFSATSDYSPYSYLSLSAIPTNFMTANADWWFAVKVETPMTNDSDGQVLFGSNNFFVAYRGNGTYFMTSSTSGYLQTISPVRIIEAGDWLIYQYNSSTNTFEAWVNGEKVLDGTTSGATPPLTAPTDMWFGSETGQASPPSGYGYPLQQCRVSNITLGSGNLADGDISQFTTGTFRTGTIGGLAGTVTNEWTFDGSAPVTQVGAINLIANGSNLSFEEI